MGTKPKGHFTLYLTSGGSSSYYPANTNVNFVNVLASELTGMRNYEVALAECIILPQPYSNHIALVCCDLVSPIIFNDTYLSVLGTYSKIVSDQLHTYRPVAVDKISSIACLVTDHKGQQLTLDKEKGATLLALHFRPKSS